MQSTPPAAAIPDTLSLGERDGVRAILNLTDLVRRLSEHQTERNLIATIFARDHLHVADSTWSKILDGKYVLSQGNKVLARLEIALQELDDEKTYGRRAPVSPVIKLSGIRAILNAVKIARNQERNRLVIYSSPTGGGKDKAAQAVIHEYPQRTLLVEATEPWRGSYFSAVKAIARRAGIPARDLTSAAAGQEILISWLEHNKPILMINEAHYMGPPALNLLKEILNRTPCVVVIFAIPSLFDRMQRSAYEECSQLRTRTCAHITRAVVPPDDADVILRKRHPGVENQANYRVILNDVVSEANRFGLLDTVFRISDIVLETATGDWPRDQFAAAIAELIKLRDDPRSAAR